MEKTDLILHESPAVIKHLEILQGIISRMAGNSASCKTWALTIITGIIAFSIQNQSIPIWTSLIPAIMFLALDVFYLGLEIKFRDLQKVFVQKLSSNTLTPGDIYMFENDSSSHIHLKYIWGGIRSFSTSFFYFPIVTLIAVLWIIGF